MKLFRVITEADDRTPDAKPGALLRMSRFYCSNTMEDVWAAIYYLRIDEGIADFRLRNWHRGFKCWKPAPTLTTRPSNKTMCMNDLEWWQTVGEENHE